MEVKSTFCWGPMDRARVGGGRASPGWADGLGRVAGGSLLLTTQPCLGSSQQEPPPVRSWVEAGPVRSAAGLLSVVGMLPA